MSMPWHGLCGPLWLAPSRRVWQLAVLRRANLSRVFLQTSTPVAVDLFEKWTDEHRLKLAYTANPRSTHDLWVIGSGKRSTNYSGERLSVVAQVSA